MDAAECSDKGILQFRSSEDVLQVLAQMEEFVGQIYYAIVIYLAPINILMNLISSCILLTKELRNPFNIILCIMSLDAAIHLLIRVTLVYRKMFAGECSVETMTYSMALHYLLETDTWPVCRATYTWLAVILTFMRFRSLRSIGKWEASYSHAFASLAGVVVVSCAAGIPQFMTTIIVEFPVDYACGNDDNPSAASNETAPFPSFSNAIFENDCLIYRLNQWMSGIFHSTLPSLCLLIFTALLTFELSRARKDPLIMAKGSAKKNDDATRAARMLTTIAVFTLLSELPQGIVSLASGLFTIDFQRYYGDRFTILWMTIQLISTSFNMLIYLTMSKNFRKVVIDALCFWRKEKLIPKNTSMISVASVRTSYSGKR